MHFQTRDFYNPKHNYMNDVIDRLCNGDSIRLGKNGDEIFYIDKKIQEYLKVEFENVEDIEIFNNICKKYGLPTWSKIFKGDFSGYTGGLASKNKGSAFEISFIKKFNEHLDNLSKIIGIDKEELSYSRLEYIGNNNTKRPLTINKSEIFIGKNPKNVGGDVADIKLITNRESYNLSLKSGNKVTFCNTGVGKYIKSNSFNNYKDTGIYYPGTTEGQLLLDLFGINNDKFANVFASYKDYKGGRKVKAATEIQDVTEYAKKPLFMNFVKSVIGYNYILIHEKNRNSIHFYNLLTEKDLDNFIGQVLNMTIYYPIDGGKKAVDIIFETTKLKIMFNFRNKSGGLIPNQFMADYIIK